MQKRWTLLDYDAEKVNLLSKRLNISEALCKILVQRGFPDFDSAKDYFRPSLQNLHSPWLMKDMDKAVNRIINAFEEGEKILVFGDYDVDGTTSVACMYSFLYEIYSPEKLDFYIPNRYKEGYGVSKDGIDFAHINNFKLIICLDCGIKSTTLIAYAKELGVDFIVCDHHLPGDELPAAVAILNAKQEGCNYPYKELCGCGVGFKLMSALTETLEIEDEILFKYLDLVATAIAADIVPMTGENRILAYYGLKKINDNPLPGIKALLKFAAKKEILNITDVVFLIAPRVNAAGRMDDGKKAVKLFISKTEEDALIYAEQLHIDNTERREVDSSITEQALEKISLIKDFDLKMATVIYNETWHKGVVGIVASRLIETHYKPTIVLTRNENLATGSARSVPGFNLYEAIYACREYLTTYGGHFAAAGLSMLPENVGAFAKKFEEVVSNTIDPNLLIPEIIIDAEIDFAGISPKFHNILKQMEPFGPLNMHPVFISKNLINNGSKLVKEKHVRFILKQNNTSFTGIGFNMADKISIVESNKPLDVVYTIDENEWNGNKNLQLKVVDVKLSAGT